MVLLRGSAAVYAVACVASVALLCGFVACFLSVYGSLYALAFALRIWGLLRASVGLFCLALLCCVGWCCCVCCGVCVAVWWLMFGVWL